MGGQYYVLVFQIGVAAAELSDHIRRLHIMRDRLRACSQGDVQRKAGQLLAVFGDIKNLLELVT